MDSSLYWYVLFIILLLGYLIIQFTVKDKKRYFIYFLCGIVLGFYFDIVSFTQGYYTYPGFYRITLLGLPFTMTLAEGFSVVICLYIIDFIRKHIEKSSAKN